MKRYPNLWKDLQKNFCKLAHEQATSDATVRATLLDAFQRLPSEYGVLKSAVTELLQSLEATPVNYTNSVLSETENQLSAPSETSRG